MRCESAGILCINSALRECDATSGSMRCESARLLWMRCESADSMRGCRRWMIQLGSWQPVVVSAGCDEVNAGPGVGPMRCTDAFWLRDMSVLLSGLNDHNEAVLSKPQSAPLCSTCCKLGLAELRRLTAYNRS